MVGGRAVAGDKASHTAMRNMMACTVTGQGAGVAAAVSIKVRFSKVVVVCKTRNRGQDMKGKKIVKSTSVIYCKRPVFFCCRLVGYTHPPPPNC